MSKLKRLLGALSLVALITFSSCVDDAVAPEVAALRQAQVDLLNQDVAFRTAETALKQAEADLKALDVAFKSANDAIILQTNQATLDDKIAKLAVTLAEQEVMLAGKQLELEQAQAALAQYLATAGLQEASYYLEQWTIAYNGGTFSAPQADGVTTTGINALSREITMLENALANDKLFLDADDSVTQAYIDATLSIALEKTIALQASRTASLPTKEAALAALEANDGYTAIAALEEDLLALAADSIAAKAALAAAQSAFDAAVAGNTAGAQAVIDEFTQEIDTIGQNVNDLVLNRTTYRQAKADSLDASVDLNNAAADTVEWLAYAFSLDSIYDLYYEPYISEYEILLAEAEQDSIDAAEALAASGGASSLVDDVEDKYNLYIIAYETLIDPVLSPNNNAADTANFVTARTDYDGLNADQIFNADGSWDLPLDGQMTSADSNWTWRDPSDAWLGARAESSSVGVAGDPTSGGQVGVGGAIAAYYNANLDDGEAAAVAEANARLVIIQNQIGALVEGFRQLEAKINAINDGSDKDGLFDFDLPDAQLEESMNATDFTSYTTMVAKIQEVNAERAARLTQDTDYITACQAYLELFTADDTYDAACNTPADVNLPDETTNPSISVAIALAKSAESALDSATANIAYAVSIVGQDAVDAYLEAVKAINANDQPTADAFGLSLVEPRLNLIAAQQADAAVASAQGGIRSMIAKITAEQLGEYVVIGEDGNQVTDFVPFSETIEELEDDIDELEEEDRSAEAYNKSIQWTADEIERINVDIAQAAQGVINVEAMIADKEAELEVKRTELTVLQALADAFQELVLASLGG